MNAVIYSRVSTEDQDNQRAIDELQAYANYAKLKVIKVFQEKISGTVKAKERSEFNALLEFVKKGKVNTILVWELSRLGRKMTDVISTVDQLSELGINIYIKKEGFNTLDKDGKKSIMTNIIISVISGFAEMERLTIIEHSRSGIRAQVAAGGSGTGILKAYGFKKVEKKLLINDDEAEIIKLMFSKYLSGLGTGQIAKYLNEKKIPTKYNSLFGEKKIKHQSGIEKAGKNYKWVDAVVWNILKNPIYMGNRMHKGEVFKVPAIVSEATFNEVQKRLNENYNKKGIHTKHENPLSNLLVCGVCGRSYFLHKRSPEKDGKRKGQILDNAYKCMSKRYGEWCGNNAVNYDRILDALFKVCQPIIFNDAIERPSAKKALKERKDNLQSEFKSIENSISNLNKKLDKIFDSYTEDLITKKKYIEMKGDIEDKIFKEGEKRNGVLKKLEELKELEIRSDSDKYDFNVFKQHIQQAIEYIKIYPAKVDTKVYTFKRDVCTMIEVKSKLDWLNDQPIYYRFILSRYSNILSIPQFRKEHPTELDITKGKYITDFKIDLKDFTPIQLKNPYLKKRTIKSNGNNSNSKSKTHSERG